MPRTSHETAILAEALKMPRCPDCFVPLTKSGKHHGAFLSECNAWPITAAVRPETTDLLNEELRPSGNVITGLRR